MTMKIEEVITGKKDQESVNLDGMSVPVATLRKLSDEGYVNFRYYKDNKTFSLWGKNCTACFTPEQLQERAKSG
jgi:hypothetical protein